MRRKHSHFLSVLFTYGDIPYQLSLRANYRPLGNIEGAIEREKMAPKQEQTYHLGGTHPELFKLGLKLITTSKG